MNRSTGEIESRRYVYADEYAITREEGHDSPRRVDFRLDWLHQHVAKIEQTNKRKRKNS